jgi:hypothetical protein
MPAYAIWILFAVACGLIAIAGIRAKHKEEKQDHHSPDPRKPA